MPTAPSSSANLDYIFVLFDANIIFDENTQRNLLCELVDTFCLNEVPVIEDEESTAAPPTSILSSICEAR